jgi:hypothetical protein
MNATEICIICDSRERNCQGPCSCRADPKRRDILVHIANASNGNPTCPLHKHDNIDPSAPMPAPEPPKPIVPIPRREWGRRAAMLADFAEWGDDGLGSACKRLLNESGHAVALLAVAVFLKHEYPDDPLAADAAAWIKGEGDCGNCEWRRLALDQKYPLR